MNLKKKKKKERTFQRFSKIDCISFKKSSTLKEEKINFQR